MKLYDILEGIAVRRREGPENPGVSSVCIDSRQAGQDGLFIAIRGTRMDGHEFIEKAIQGGARVIVCEKIPPATKKAISYIEVARSAEAAGLIASAFNAHPSRQMKVIGITGTNGKTTVATLLHHIFMESGKPAGLISTIQNQIGWDIQPATHTTPDPIQIQELLGQMVRAGCQYCFMEVSSHAIDQDRIAGIRFTGGVFTNISHEHLDYHRSFKAYLEAKKKFFDFLPREAFALINVDDRNGNYMVQNCRALIRRYSLSGMADYKAKIIESHLDGMLLRFDDHELWTRLTGKFNALNLLAVYAVSNMLDLSKSVLLPCLSNQSPVRGRFETLRSEAGITAVIDYAHTPDALKNALATIRQVGNNKIRLITVIGAGGNRDVTKRPKMGAIAAELSQEVILTSDNPRHEKPEKIIAEMLAGIPENERKRVLSIPDRKEAIRTAVVMARPGDVILVAGKGHETYQEIQGERKSFDDLEIVRELMDIKN